jgi:DNA helicase-2/ATP-dependent DNA helicase PcrA
MLASALPGDFVLSRINAPLIGHALKLLREGRRATVLGRDIGTNLAGIVRRSKAATVIELDQYLDGWVANENARLMAKNPPKEQEAQIVSDKAECIRALAEAATSVQVVLDRIESLFTDLRDSNAVVFSTTHKAKGLEADRVWMLADTYRRRPSVEEDNLYYVACTRARQELVMVRKEQAA